MSEEAPAFLRELAARGHEPGLEHATGTIRFDLTDEGRTTRWLITIDKGDVALSRGNAKADCVVKTDHALADGIVRGEINPVAALLRGAIAAEGDIRLFVLFMRVLPSPPRSS